MIYGRRKGASIWKKMRDGVTYTFVDEEDKKCATFIYIGAIAERSTVIDSSVEKKIKVN